MVKAFKKVKSHIIFILLALVTALSFVGYSAFLFKTVQNDIALNSNNPIVAYIGNQGYRTIEDALIASKAGNTIHVVAGTNPVITGRYVMKGSEKVIDPNSVTIKTGVKLNIPYAMDESGKVGVANNETATVTGGGHAKSNAANLKNNVTIADGVTLLNYGTIEIGGQLSGGAGGSANSGQTAGQYAKITMRANSVIECGNKLSGYSGNINCFGYIMDSSSEAIEDDPEINVRKGYVKMPFSVKDFRGGTQSVLIVKAAAEVSPFNQYELINIEAKLRIEAGCNILAMCNLRASNAEHATTGKIVGNDANSLIQLGKNSVFESKFDAKTNICDIHLYGGAIMNSLSLNIGLAGVGTISTKDVYFPITWRHHITLHPLADGVVTSYEMKNKTKIMPGSYLKISKYCTLTADLLTVYDCPDQADMTKPRVDPYYNDNGDIHGGIKYMANMPKNLGSAEIIVDGSLIARGLGGFIQTTSEGATVSISTYSTIKAHEVKHGNPGDENSVSALLPWPKPTPASTYIITNPSRGYFTSKADTITNFNSNAPTSVISKGNYWEDASTPYPVRYKRFYGDTSKAEDYLDSGNPNECSPAGSIALKPAPASYNGYTFVGWYFGSDTEMFKPVPESTLKGSDGFGWMDETQSVTLYAYYTKTAQLTIKFSYTESSPTLKSDTNIPDIKAFVDIPFNLPDVLKCAFNPIVGSNGTSISDLQKKYYATESWNIVDSQGNVLLDHFTGESVINNTTETTLYLKPNVLFVGDFYKIVVEFQDVHKIDSATIVGSAYGEVTDISHANGTTLWLIENSGITVNLAQADTAEYFGTKYRVTNVSFFDLFGTELPHTNADGTEETHSFWNKYSATSGTVILGTNGLKIKIVEDRVK